MAASCFSLTSSIVCQTMATHVLALTTVSGLPIFSKKRGDKKKLPFSSIASLNGVSMFSKCQDIILKNLKIKNGIVIWKEYFGSITLIGITNRCLECDINALLDAIFNAMVMFVSLDELKSPRNLERLKRDLRSCYPLIDKLMESLDPQNTSSMQPAFLLNSVEAILCPENQTLEPVLENFTSRMSSVFGCLCVYGRFACGTAGWRTLSSLEKHLLLRLVSIDSDASLRDTAIYLCHRSPNIAFRAVICQLIPEVHVVVICGPTPALSDVNDIVLNCWQQHFDILQVAKQRYPRNFPPTLQFPYGVMGVLLSNYEEQKYVASRSLQPVVYGRRFLTEAHHFDILRTFYLHAIQDFGLLNEDHTYDDLNNTQSTESSKKESVEIEENKVSETYWRSEYHNCHAYKLDENICCVLYASVVPITTMRLITKNILQDILSDKTITW